LLQDSIDGIAKEADSIDGIAKEAEAFISYLYCMTSSDKRNKLLPAYRQFLKDMISDADTLLKKK
jgi:hypothetical protein